jgi:peptidoglycan biosynthesis protein MviN/MurJ (putative lipid II flippase)
VARINTSKVILGGLVAGVVINISEYILNVPVFGAEVETIMAAHNIPPMGGGVIATFILLGFVVGVALVWLYAAIRPRLGPGPKTAAIAGVAVWVLAYLYSGVAFCVLGLMTERLLVIGLIWGLVELIVAGIAGAWLYSEA